MTLTLLALLAQEDIRVTTDRTVDTRSLETIVRDVIRLSGAKTDDEKAIAIHTWLHQAIFHFAYPVEKGSSVGPLKVLNVYGWGLCGGQHTVLKALFETAGWPVRYRGWSDPGHTTIEVQYGGRWHYFDVFLKCYFWMKDRSTIAGQDDIIKDPSIVLDALKDGRVPAQHYLCCGDDAPGIVQGCKNSKALPPSKPSEGWASVTGRDQGYSPALRLPHGATLRLEWKSEPGKLAIDNKGSHSCGNKDFRSDPQLGPLLEHYGTRNHSNGTLVYEAKAVKAGEVVDLSLPYPYVSATVEGNASLSTDGGKTWVAAAGDVSALVRQRYDVRLRAEGTSLRLQAVVEHNRSVLPYLLPGKNAVKVEAPPGVSVTYAWQEATAPPTRKRWDGQGVSYGEPKTWRNVPGTFLLDVGGNTPPKMLYLEFSRVP
ncbi:MAG TPA: hypothetical protein VF950_23970 [Planctomycetota bacterium]